VRWSRIVLTAFSDVISLVCHNDESLCYNEIMADETTPPVPELPAQQSAIDKIALRRRRNIIIVVSIGAVLFVALVIFSIWYLLQPTTQTQQIQDVFVIFMALESLVVGVALVVLVVQLATLINLLQNEVRPMLESTNETLNTLRGTTAFLSENLVEPVIKLNEYLAGLQRVLELIGLKRK
jgi:hypothetical protein